ncbi:MAG: transposase zinc-binding domain-containing protein [Deltaproteobacteria bacterium]|nr:transposase zinc-binding domain-containing protein [Deltaproteobacteria bacterium]MBW2447188.1 transposase zinc-binding domain-containing protein [Deltaproteobacteria bacterium]
MAPHFIEQELRAFLRCGVLAHGFLRLHCDGCGHDRLVAFSCKRRGFCPSCGGRRMADTAAHLVDRVLPEVPIRQWVLTLPYPLRYRCAYDAALTSAVLRAFIRALFAELRRRERERWDLRPEQCGADRRASRHGGTAAISLSTHEFGSGFPYSSAISAAGAAGRTPIPSRTGSSGARWCSWSRARRSSRPASGRSTCRRRRRARRWASGAAARSSPRSGNGSRWRPSGCRRDSPP